MAELINKDSYIKSLFQIVRGREPSDKEYQLLLSRLNDSKVTLTNTESLSSDSLIPIWAEENSSLSTTIGGGQEWAFGNGANTPENLGLTIPFSFELVYGTLTLRQGTAIVGIYINGSKVLDVAATGITNPKRASAQVTTPVTYPANSSISFRTQSSSNTNSPNVVSAWIRKIN